MVYTERPSRSTGGPIGFSVLPWLARLGRLQELHPVARQCDRRRRIAVGAQPAARDGNADRGIDRVAVVGRQLCLDLIDMRPGRRRPSAGELVHGGQQRGQELDRALRWVGHCGSIEARRLARPVESLYAAGMDAYDFIVTGAGSAGCAIAGRLSEDGRFRVLLLEAGPPDSYPRIHIPLGYHKTFNNPKVNWMFDSEPEPELNNPIMYQPRGKVLGGASSINGMVYMRGNAADYDEWRQRGCEGWDYESVLPYFKRAEDNVRGSDDFHGTGGPLKVQDHAWQPTLAKAMHDAAIEAGIPANPDFNGANQEGVGYYQTTINRSRRWSSARAYLGRAKQLKNLTIATSAHATRLLIENDRCVGVEYRTRAGLVQARANREVIVSGGVYGSPHLLMLSGLGPAKHLKQHGIP